jgi:regulator of replication initiation timing
MNENPNSAGESAATPQAQETAPQSNNAPLAENQYVQELFSILQDNGRDTKGLAALIGHVEGMENYIKRAEDKISDMKSQLAEMKEVQNHPIKTALQNAIKTLEHKVAQVREQISELKINIVEGCKNAVTAFKEKGATALTNLAKFFHIKGALKAIDKDITQSVETCDKAVANINRFSLEYHSAGRAIKNMGRMFVGKEPVDAKKEAGKLAKTIAAPYKAEKAVLNGIKKAVDKAITALDGMETRQAEKKAERAASRPDFMAKLNTHKERVEREKLELPTPERTKTAGLEV